MPKIRSQSQSLEAEINNIVSRAAQEIAEHVRGNIADEVMRVMTSSGAVGRSLGRGSPLGVTPSRGTGGVRRRPATARVSRSCPFPGCTNPSKGPRFSWFCAEHRTLPEAEKQRIKAQAQAQGGGASNGGGASESSSSTSGGAGAAAGATGGKKRRRRRGRKSKA